jgi:microcystin degradation protein MlrC
MRVFFGSILTETNTFAAAPTGAGAWQVERGVPNADELWGPLVGRLAAAHGDAVIWGLRASAQPDGATLRPVYQALRNELLGELRAALPVGAVLLPLHGAMVAEGYPDCEGDLIGRVREIVGPEVPIGVELDLHCHFTEAMRTRSDVVIAYKEYPHTDVADRFEELYRITRAAAEGRVRPVTAVFDCRMVNFWHTTREPMRSFVQRMKDLEGRDGVLSVSFGQGFPYGDVPEAGAKVWVVADGDEATAARVAQTLGRELWAMRGRTSATQSSVDDMLAALHAQAPGAKPIVIADIADNPGGGASSDSTFILEALVDAGIRNVAFAPLWDLGALQICRDAGVGARLALRVGGKCGPASGRPVDLLVTVKALKDQHEQRWNDYPPLDCGAAAWVATNNGIDIVLISKRQQAFGTSLFSDLGIDLATKRAIVVKSSQHFHAQFAPLASQVLYVTTPGLLRTDFENIAYRHRDLNYWPRVHNPWADEVPA